MVPPINRTGPLLKDLIMRYLILTVALFSVSACVKPQEPAKIACIDGILHEENSPNSGVYVPIYEYVGGVKQSPMTCKTLGPARDVAANKTAPKPEQSPVESY